MMSIIICSTEFPIRLSPKRWPIVFQKRDLELLGIKDENPEKEKMDILDKIWSMYEICGVSMLDISVWKWMYAQS